MSRIGYVCTDDDLFLRPLLDRLRRRHEVVDLREPDGEGGTRMPWPPPVDLVWIEWASQLAVQITALPRRAPIIVRLHSYEIFTELLALWEESAADPAARAHAAFFLCRMSAYAGDVEGVLRWGEACEELCPDRAAAAPFWCWYAQAMISRRGPEAGRAVIERGLRHHPRLPDLLHARLSLAARDWYEAARDRSNLPGTPSSSRRHLGGIERAVEALGLSPDPREAGPSTR